MEYEETMEETMDKEAEEDVAPNIEETDKVDVAAMHQVTWHNNDGGTECGPTQVPTAEHLHKATRRR